MPFPIQEEAQDSGIVLGSEYERRSGSQPRYHDRQEFGDQRAHTHSSTAETAHEDRLSIRSGDERRDPPSSVTESETTSNAPPPKVVYRREFFNPISSTTVHVEELDDLGYPKEQVIPRFEVVDIVHTDQGGGAAGAKEGAEWKRPRITARSSVAIVINSPAIIHALRAIVGYYPDADLSGDSIRLEEPFLLVAYHREELRTYAERYSPDIQKPDNCAGFEDTHEDITFLLEFVEKRIGRGVMQELERHRAPKPVCTFDMLWILFKPGTRVYHDRHDDGGYNNAAVIKSIDVEIHGGSVTECNIMYWNMAYDDVYVGASNALPTEIEPFHGEKEIGSLHIFPCEYLKVDRHKESHVDKRQKLERRGGMFFELLKGPKCMMFDGLSSHWPKRHYTGLVIVDVPEYCTRLLKWAAKKTTFSNYTKINPLTVDKLDADKRFLCSDTMPAFMFKHRAWKDLNVDGFSEPAWQMDLVDRLIIPTATRTVLRQLTNRYTRSGADVAWSADLLHGKGEGLVVLLHGKPGVGKTYTAECVAQEARRPLISLTCADIGTAASSVELTLEYWFKVAKQWGAILLLDEADVYMDRRTTADLERNNLVAGFLRALEYYQGILFLTTNRIGTFDEAFLSRIDVPIYYPNFTNEQRLRI
ncbi:hypothetical protein LTR36_009278 [Oleoguttula mirabilis]|uniref:AAA+ ATPase domain-containing protein n=1 Tax=Oleoguttula mirabilis TaxID=1507867 RepID=A0AAV9J634_9PEZI|nr:hypothetical protein LTR36_009278 [Oleoguttula mirabilis]